MIPIISKSESSVLPMQSYSRDFSADKCDIYLSGLLNTSKSLRAGKGGRSISSS
jgi:hypothetical protein